MRHIQHPTSNKGVEKGPTYEQEVKHSDDKCTVFGSSSFGSGKHSWKVCISGNFTAGFAFGVSPLKRCPCKSKWTWTSGKMSSSLNQHSAFAHCKKNDVIYLYLDCDNQTLMMYNQRSSKFDTWSGIQGAVRPVFELCCIGDEVTLPCQLLSSRYSKDELESTDSEEDDETFISASDTEPDET